MSRNFELLQQIGKEQEIFPGADAERETGIEPISPNLPPVTSESVRIEEVTALVQRLFRLPGVQAPRTVVFAGTERNNGCTWICARVGEALASQFSASVCLVDAHLSSPHLHELFGQHNHHGLSDSLLRPDPMGSFVLQLAQPNLAMVSCGGTPERARGLLSSNRMRARLAELRSMFEYVLVDASAVSSSKDAIILGAGSDGVVLVLKANASRREAAHSAVQELQAAGVRVLGTVLNQRTFPIPEAIYKKL